MRMSRFALLATAPLALAAIVATAPRASAGDISEALTSNGPSLNGIFPNSLIPNGVDLNGTVNALTNWQRTIALNQRSRPSPTAGTSLADLSGVRVEAVVLPGAAR